MKKTLAILLALAMVFSTLTVAFAEGTIGTDAQACVTLGMLKGDTSAGVTADYVATAPKRIQAAILFLRLKGLEPAALAFTGTDNFADADQAAWAKPVMAYLKANPELGFSGVGNNNFDPNGLMNASQYYKVVLTALGYKQSETGVVGDFAWENVLAFAESKGLKNVATVTNFTVNDLAIATIEGLKATVKGTEKTLAATLIDSKAITEAAAVAAGVYTSVPAVLAVESVKAVNLKETVVTFNKEVDEKTAEDLSNYLLDDEDIAADIALNADKKSVTITWDKALENQTEFDLTISGVLDAAGAELDEVTVTFLANDVTLPVAESIKLVGPNKFKVIFSEPINDDEDLITNNYGVTVEDKDFDYEVANIAIDGNEATIELSDDELEAGDYSVEVTGFQDYADLKALKKTFTLAYAKDTTAPVATVTKSNQSYVTVEFNKPVYNGDANEEAPLTVDFFYHTYKDFVPVYVSTTDNETFKVYFTVDAANSAIKAKNETLATDDRIALLDADVDDLTDRPLPEGNVKFVVVCDGDGDITDEWGNVMKDDTNIALTISSDTTAPTVTKVDNDGQNDILVYFSEDIATPDEDNFTVVNEDGDEVNINKVTYSNEDDEYVATLNFTTALEGDYTVTVSDIVDLALEENEIAKVEKKITVADETAPIMTTAEGVRVIGIDKNGATGTEVKSTDVDYIYVTFPEDMTTTGTYSVLNKDNYQIRKIADGTLVDLKADDKIATAGGNDRIKITIDKSGDYDVADGSIEIVIGRVADSLGNVTKGNNVNAAFLVKEEVSPYITAVKTLTKKTVEITINGELKAVNKAYIKVNHGANAPKALYAVSTWKLDKGNTVITGVLPSTEYLATSDDVNLTVTLTTDDLVTVSGTKVDYDVFSDIDDGIAPSVTKTSGKYNIAMVSGETAFTVEFDENLTATADVVKLYAQDLVLKDSKGNVLVAGLDYTTELGDTNNVIKVVLVKDEPKVGDYKVYSVDTIKYIRDASGNKANAFTTIFTLEDFVK